MHAMAVESQGLGKRFGGQCAVSDVAIAVPAGAIYGFLGSNGSGKTTTIRMMLGLLRPTAGCVRVFGHDVATAREQAARLVGSLLEARSTYDHLSARENLDLTRRLLGLPGTEIDRVLEIVRITEVADRKVGHFSLGMRQRLGLARALLGSPRLLVLDEPMNGLDPDGIRDMRALIRALPAAVNTTVFLSSHLLAEVEQIATHIGVMSAGKLIVQGEINALFAKRPSDLFIRTHDRPQTLRHLQQAGYQPEIEADGVIVRIDSDRDGDGDDARAAAINRTLVQRGVGVIELTPRRRSLESLYMDWPSTAMPSEKGTVDAASC
jgi:lantibiotic transport system ATP-binding protein